MDDHPLVRDWLKNLLQTERDFEVIGEADEALSALAAMSQDPPEIAIVDLSLKRGSGLDVIKLAHTGTGSTEPRVVHA